MNRKACAMSNSLSCFHDKGLVLLSEGIAPRAAVEQLEAFGARIFKAASPSQAMELIRSREVDALVIDLALSDEALIAVIDELEASALPFVLAVFCSDKDPPEGFHGYALAPVARELSHVGTALFGAQRLH
jgi:DNA-binding NarL/FixJ family response regulator